MGSDLPLNPKEFSQQIIASAQEGIIVLDRELRYVLWNPFMEELSGTKEAEVLGKCPWDVFPFLREVGLEGVLRTALAGQSGTTPDVLSRGSPSGRVAWTSGR